MKKFRKKLGESLVEVVIAVFVVAIGSGAATTLIVTAMQANSFSKDNLIGLNLAVEGIEAMRNIRDTNWVKFGFDKDSCWNIIPEAGPGDCTPITTDLIPAGVYSLDLDTDGAYSWTLSEQMAGNPLDLSNAAFNATNEHYRLGFVDTTPAEDTDGNGTLDDDPDLYVTEAAKGSPTPDPGQSKFYRMVEIDYDGIAEDLAEEMTVNVVVQWRGGGASVHEVELSTTLTQYQ